MSIPCDWSASFNEVKKVILEKFGYEISRFTFFKRKKLKLKNENIPSGVRKYLNKITEETSYEEANDYTVKHFGYVLPRFSYDLYYNKRSKTPVYYLYKRNGKIIYHKYYNERYDFDIYGYVKELALKYNYEEIQDILEKEKGIKLSIPSIRGYANCISYKTNKSAANEIYKKFHPEFNTRDGYVLFLDNDPSNTREENLLFIEKELAINFFKFDFRKFSPEEKKTAYLTVKLNERIKELETIIGEKKYLTKEKQQEQDNVLSLFQAGLTRKEIERKLKMSTDKLHFYRRRLKALGLLK